MRFLTLIALAAFLTSCQTSEYTLNISADVDNDNQIFLIALDDSNPVSYTHLTLPTICSV